MTSLFIRAVPAAMIAGTLAYGGYKLLTMYYGAADATPIQALDRACRSSGIGGLDVIGYTAAAGTLVVGTLSILVAGVVSEMGRVSSQPG